MDIEKAWNKAIRNTEIIRMRIASLKTNSQTRVPYVLLSESVINEGDTIVRRGEIVVERPALIIPPNNPQFYGFGFDSDISIDENSLINFLLVRGITLPSLRYDNKTSSLDIFEGGLSKAIEYYNNLLQRQEDVYAGLVSGPEDCWQFSLLIFICAQIARNLDSDIKKLIDEYFRREKGE